MEIKTDIKTVDYWNVPSDQSKLVENYAVIVNRKQLGWINCLVELATRFQMGQPDILDILLNENKKMCHPGWDAREEFAALISKFNHLSRGAFWSYNVTEETCMAWAFRDTVRHQLTFDREFAENQKSTVEEIKFPKGYKFRGVSHDTPILFGLHERPVVIPLTDKDTITISPEREVTDNGMEATKEKPKSSRKTRKKK